MVVKEKRCPTCQSTNSRRGRGSSKQPAVCSTGEALPRSRSARSCPLRVARTAFLPALQQQGRALCRSRAAFSEERSARALAEKVRGRHARSGVREVRGRCLLVVRSPAGRRRFVPASRTVDGRYSQQPGRQGGLSRG